MANLNPLNTSFPKTMIGVATAQNTVNTVPAIQLGIPNFQFIETEGAKKKGWVALAEKALSNKKIMVKPSIFLNTEIESDPFQICTYLPTKVDSNHPILWNIGGGQKNHILGLWETFKLRKNYNDQVCYSNIQSRVIELWSWEDDKIKHYQIPLDYEDELSNYLTVYGFEIKEGGEGNLLYENGKIKNKQETFDWFQFQEFRYFVASIFEKKAQSMPQTFTLEEVKKKLNGNVDDLSEELFQILLKNNPQIKAENDIVHLQKNVLKFNILNLVLSFIKKKLLVNERFLPKEFTFSDPALIENLEKIELPRTLKKTTENLGKILGMSSGFYFENILISQIQKILEKGNHIITKAYANVKIKSRENEAEFDILLLTSLGTLHVLDGKLDAFDKKDENSRKHVLSQAGGAFSSFQPVFLFYPEDMTKDHISQSILQKLKDYAVSKSNFMIFNTTGNATERITIDEIEVEVKHFNNLLQHLGLKKN
ncbi:hypothetical protein [Cyclobacterium qasimii]|nr:hypothetical protein [Cyclobacterium qasimii]